MSPFCRVVPLIILIREEEGFPSQMKIRKFLFDTARERNAEGIFGGGRVGRESSTSKWEAFLFKLEDPFEMLCCHRSSDTRLRRRRRRRRRLKSHNFSKIGAFGADYSTAIGVEYPTELFSPPIPTVELFHGHKVGAQIKDDLLRIKNIIIN